MTKKKKSFLHRLEIFLRATRRLLNIRNSSDPEGTIKSISDNIALKGYNIWILVCSALLASIGLDTNSTAVIIGAMLISPLMSPILGVGLGLGINDQQMFVKSIRNLSVATFASLLASVIYFRLTPFGIPNSEIMSRTYPTLLDVLIAFFGGTAGIVSGSRKEKTNAIPGVAIATALMPPLCVAGFGLAKLQPTIFLGAFYLFIINAVFISISTYLIIKYLRFPMHKEPDESTQRAVRRAMLVSLLVVTAPSIYFLFSFVSRVQKVRQIEQLVTEVSDKLIEDNQHEILNVERPRSVNEINKVRNIKIYVSGEAINDSLRNEYVQKFKALGDYNFRISLLNNVSEEELQELSYSDKITRDNVLQLKTRYQRLEGRLDTFKMEQTEYLSTRNIELTNKNILSELKVFFPDLDTVKVIDYRKPEIPSREIIATNKSLDSLQSDSLNPDLYITRQDRFPYLKMVCVMPTDPNDSLNVLIDSLSSILRDSYAFVKIPQFPYIKIDHLDTVSKLQVASAEDNQSDVQENRDEGNNQEGPTRKEKDVEVILIWNPDVRPRSIDRQARDRIRNFLKIKLIEQEEDSLNIVHFGPLFIDD